MRCCCDKAAVIKALSEGTRLEIMQMLSGGEMCACKILEKFRITQPTLSYHMRILTECGIVAARRDGAWMHYSLNDECIKELISFLNGLLKAKKQQNINCKGGC
jgi:ArsR family transcriptional regulator, arsenate/arsenite/antimonite-responsive transcriptional repressor